MEARVCGSVDGGAARWAGRWAALRAAQGTEALRPGRARRRSKGPAGMIATAVLGLLFLCYLTNAGDVRTFLDGWWADGLSAVHTHDAAIAKWFVAALPYVAMGFGLLLVYLVVGPIREDAALSEGRPAVKGGSAEQLERVD